MSHSSYCPNCGAGNSADSIFCEQCGYQMLTGNHGKPSSFKMGASEKITKPAFSSESQSPRGHYRRYRNRRTHKGAKITFLAIFLTVFIIGGAMFTFFILPQLNTSYNYIGTRYMDYHHYDNPAMTEAEFIIDNAVGGVHVFFDDNSSNELVGINLHISGRSSVTIDDAAQFDTYSYGNRTLFIFSSVDRTLPNAQWYDYQYDIEIRLSTQIMGSFNIHVSSGEITFHSDENAKVNELLLDTASGNIFTNIYDSSFLNTQGFNMIQTVSGDIESYFVNLKADNITSWDISSVSGSVHLYVGYNFEPPTLRQLNFDIETISGEITYEFIPYIHYNTSEEISFGYTIDANTLTGSISLISSYNGAEIAEFPYTTLNYGFASLNFNLILTSVSGSITIVEV